MTKHASNRTQMNAASQGGYNSSPFSAGLFTNRRVWVKKIDGTPTTILVHQNDIMDDLKQAIMLKFPNSLAKQFDPADFTVKMDLSSRRTINLTGMGSMTKKQTSKQGTSSPEISKASLSPVTSSSFGYINLEPDKNVWSILDTYYPKGMTMSEAFLIDVPVVDHISLPNSNNGSVSSTNGNFSSTRSFQNSMQTGYSQLHHPQPQPTGETPYGQNPPQQRAQRFASYSTSGGGPYIDRAISPATVQQRQSPSHTAPTWHKRSHSHNSQSPSNANSQAVLLLPRNFSLATGSSSNTNSDKKRISLDDNYTTAGKDAGQHSILSPHIQGTNITNVGSIIEPITQHSPSFPLSVNKNDASLHKLDIQNGSISESLDEPSSESISTIAEMSNSAKTLPITDHLHLKSDKADNGSGIAPSHHKSISADSVSISPSPIPTDHLNRLSANKNNSIIENTSSIHKDVKYDSNFVDKEKLNLRKKGAENESKLLKSSKTTIEKVLPSISVLVVEDNAINQAILGAFLRKHKIHYKIAKNGQEAIDNWRQGGFHLVLMDIQLPVKSGIDATKEIRHLEKVNKIGVFAQHELNNGIAEVLREEDKLDLDLFRSPVIIVALTASSNSSIDRKNALMAGCNDYLTKPVNLVWLQNKITEWGCMQALIDFDGWSNKKPITEEPSSKLSRKLK